MKKQIWLTEQEIGDLVAADPNLIFFKTDAPETETHRVIREFQIGRGRVDFAQFSKGPGIKSVISMFELKITASMFSVHQVVKYKQDLEEYLRQAFYTQGVDHEKCPKVEVSIGAVHMDREIFQICLELGIWLFQIDVRSKTEIYFDPIFHDFAEVPDNPGLCSGLVDFYGARL